MKFLLALMSLALSFPVGAQVSEDPSVLDYGLLRPAIVNGDVVPDSMSDLRAMTPRIYIMNTTEEFATESFCTGLLIAPNVVLTAAHCVDADPDKLMIQVYFQNREVGVTRIVVHPQYDPLKTQMDNGKMIAHGGYNDVALLFLEENMNMITPALLPEAGYNLKDKHKVFMAGYGLLGNDRANAHGELHYVKVSVEEISKGRLRINGKKTSCEGDSGGPLLKKHEGRWMSVGVVSIGDCEKIATPMRTSSFTEWIQNEIAKARSFIQI